MLRRTVLASPTEERHIDAFVCEQSFLFSEAEAVIDTDLRLDVLRRLAVATIQTYIARTNSWPCF